jgi:hypothetical protein
MSSTAIPTDLKTVVTDRSSFFEPAKSSPASAAMVYPADFANTWIHGSTLPIR